MAPLPFVTAGDAPVITEHLNDEYVRQGENAKFECRVRGQPEPEITW